MLTGSFGQDAAFWASGTKYYVSASATAGTVNYKIQYKLQTSAGGANYGTAQIVKNGDSDYWSGTTDSPVALETIKSRVGTINGFGYASNNWYYGASATLGGSNATSFTIRGDGTLLIELLYNYQTYTITYDLNKGTGSTTPSNTSPTSYNVYSTTSLLAPTRDGYTFAGWKATETVGSWTSGTNYAAGTSLTNKYGNAKLQAQWTKKTITITLKQDDATTTGTTSVSATFDTTTSFTITNPQRVGYTFKGWTTTNGGSTIVIGTDGKLVASIDGYTNSSKVWIRPTATTVYAKWTANTYTIAYNNNGGSGSIASKSGVAYTANYTTKGKTDGITKTGYTLIGWGKTQTSGKTYELSTSVAVSTLASNAGVASTNGATITLYAVWQANTYTITFDGNGGKVDSVAVGSGSDGLTVSGTTATATYDKTGKFTTTVSRTGFTFKGWANKDSSGNYVVSLATGATYTKFGGTDTVYSSFVAKDSQVLNWATSGSVALYAVWEANYVKVTLNLNITVGSTNITFNGSTYTTASANPVMYVKYGDTTTPSTYANLKTSTSATSAVGLLNPTRNGYTFKGWYKEPTFTTPITNSSSVVSASAHTLYAKWTAIQYTVTYHKNYGTDVSYTDTTKATFDSSYTFLTESAAGFTVTGWTFAHWATSTTGGTTYNAGASITYTTVGNLALYAIRNANTYTITLNQIL